MRKFLLLILFLTPLLFIHAQDGYGERLVTPVNMALGITGAGVKEKVIYFEVPFKDRELFSTIAFKFFNIDDEAIKLDIAYTHQGNKFTNWKPLHFDHHVKAEAGFIVTELEYIPVEYDRLRIRIFTDQVKKFKAEAHWFIPGGEFTLDRNTFPQTSKQLANCILPDYVTRTGWNCPSGQDYSNGTPSFTNVSHLVVHHSAGSNTSTNWPAVVLSIWNYHRFTNGWSDIGYNALIDPNGVIYEGRGGNDGYTKDVLSAATCGSNSGSMAICILGNYNDVQPTSASLESLERMLAWKAEDSSIDPTGSSSLNSFGVLDHIFGHRQGCSTSCPGDNLYAKLPDVRTNVDGLVTNGCTQGNPSLETLSYFIDDDLFDDSNGDDDGLADGGEDIEIYLTVENNGDIPVTNVIATISMDESCINIVDNDFSFGTLVAGQDSTDGDFDLSISESCEDQDVEFYVTYSSDQGTWKDTIVIHIYNPCNLPSASFTASPLSGIAPLTVNTFNSSENASAYNWLITGPEEFEFDTEEPTFELTVPGQYSVLLTALNECGPMEMELVNYIEVLETTGIGENELVKAIYPNPVRKKLNVDFGTTVEQAEITVINAIGQEVYKSLFSGIKTQLDVKNLSTGQYILRIIENDKPENPFTYSFIKEN